MEIQTVIAIVSAMAAAYAFRLRQQQQARVKRARSNAAEYGLVESLSFNDILGPVPNEPKKHLAPLQLLPRPAP